mgnify:CR=1 FL=1
MKVLFVMGEVEALGIEYLSSFLKANGHDTRLLFDPRLFNYRSPDFRNEFLEKVFDLRQYLVKHAKMEKPDLIAFSVLSNEYYWARDLAKVLKDELPRASIVFGNIHPSTAADHVLKNIWIDFVIRGEGEHALCELADSLEQGKDFRDIKNLCYRSDGKIVKNPLRPHIADLDSLPFPDRDLFFNIGYPFNIGQMVMASRGCSFACTFCSNNAWRKMYFGENYMTEPSYLRKRSVDNVIKELKWAKERYDPKLIRFNDDDLFYPEAWLKEFSKRYREEIGLPYKCFANPNSVNEETVSYLKSSGCKQVQMGIQTANPDVRKIIGRPMPNEIIKKAIQLIREEAGITLIVDNMFGLPGEKEDDYEALLKFYRENPVDSIQCYFVKFWPGTDILRQAVENGILSKEMAEQLEEEPFRGDINAKMDVHPDEALPYYMLFETWNYFPRIGWLLEKLRFHYFMSRFSFNPFNLLKFIYMMVLRRTDRFQHPRHGYELSGHRYPRVAIKWGFKRILLYARELIRMESGIV